MGKRHCIDVNYERRPTQRAADKWDSAHFIGIFLASGLYCPQAESQPAHLRLTQAVRQFILKDH